MAAIAITLGNINSHPQWYLYLAPYLAISAMLYAGSTERFMFFEAIGSLALLGYNFVHFYWVYVPKSAKGMLMDILIGGRTGSNVVSNIVSAAAQNDTKKYLKIAFESALSSTGGVYIACMIIILLLLCRKQNLNANRQLNIRPLAMSRLFLNALACYIPLAAFTYVSL